MKEAANEDYKAYENFSALFIRPLKPGIRPIDDSALVSPVDGRVVQFGLVKNRKIEMVKGHDYEFDEFFGPVDIKIDEKHMLYQFVIFLRPSDYHCYHSPTDWEATLRVDHAGHMLPFKRRFWFHNWFNINARVCLIGKWKYGFFSMTPVAATTVGDMVLEEKAMQTTEKVIHKMHDFTMYDQHFKFNAGDKVGEFHAGSIVVLIFEAPPGLEWSVQPNQSLKYGNQLIANAL
jgi:phosphatidylserine decarboxylase